MRIFFIPTLCFLILAGCSRRDARSLEEVWQIDNTHEIAGHAPQVLGSPVFANDADFPSLQFNGVNDGLILPVNPVEGLERFTVQVLFFPDSDGPAEQRFIHFEDDHANRGLIETRVTPEGTWTLDTFLYDGHTGAGLTLIDRNIQHPADQWYWAALVYDGEIMSHYVNGERELSGNFSFGPMIQGRTSVGVRLNQVHWFKGKIAEVRFHAEALPAHRLLKP